MQAVYNAAKDALRAELASRSGHMVQAKSGVLRFEVSQYNLSIIHTLLLN